MCLGMTGVVTHLRDDDGIPMALIDTGTGHAGPGWHESAGLFRNFAFMTGFLRTAERRGW
jgi:hypothetical protein